VSYSTVVLLPLTPITFADCKYLDRCNRALTSDGCASCRFDFAGFNADTGSYPTLIAISWIEAAR
jgi:hypothetical protein